MLLVTSAEMKMLDATLLEEVGIAAPALMESVGLRIAQLVIDLVDGVGESEFIGERSASAKRSTKRTPMIAVVVGKGHNGADGLVAARYLHAFGYEVRVWLAVEEWELATFTQGQFGAYRKLQGKLANEMDDFAQADVIIDAILGNGSSLPVRDQIRPLLCAINRAKRPVVAVDLPTGLDADTGQVDPDCIAAKVTVACGFAKPGLYVQPGKSRVGRVVVAPLTMTYSMAKAQGAHHYLVTEHEVARGYRPRPQNSHKGVFGRIGVLAGSEGMYGAARLTVEAAYRAGAGLVHYFAPEDLASPWLTAFPAEVVVRRYAGRTGVGSQTAIESLVSLLHEMDAGVLGPGIGKGLQTQIGVGFAFADVTIPLVLDADFLQMLAASGDQGRNWFARRKQSTVITPHPKEFAQLLTCSVSDVQANRLRYAREYAVATRAVVVLKGSGTVIAAPEGTVWINQTGNSGLATGGTGDVLAGLIGGLLASGYDAKMAAMIGVYVHGKAAECACEKQQSEESLLASDLLQWIGPAFRQISWEMDISLDG